MEPERLIGVWAKIERADQHIANLQVELTAFKRTNPYPVAAEHDRQTRELIYKVVSVADPPPAVPLLAGDAIHNLRSALDHLAYQLFDIGPNRLRDGRHVYFPTTNHAGTPNDASKFSRDVQGIGDGAKSELRKVEAYEGGQGHQIWALHKLNNTDKHRLLLTVGAAYRTIKMRTYNSPSFQHFTAMTEDGRWHNLTGALVHPLLDLDIDLKDPICPLKPGKVLFRGLPDTKPNPYADFGIDIALDEPEVARGEPILVTLGRFC